MLLPDPIWTFIQPLESANFEYIITGSIATIFYGEPRLTHDIDIVLHLRSENVSSLEKLFPLEDFYCPPKEVIHVEMNRRPYGHFNLIHHQTGFKADVYLDGEDALHLWALEHRKRVEFVLGQSLWLAPPEYVIIRKLEFYREGRSDKHLRDIQNMLPQVRSQIDKEFLNSQLQERGLNEFWLAVSKT